MVEREDRHRRLAAAGTWLAAARERAGLTQAELGFAIGTTKQSISNWERGISAVPDDAAQRLATTLGVGVIEARRALGLWVPDDAVDAPTDDVDLVTLIRRDHRLLPEARRHFENQYKLLLRVSEARDSDTVQEDADILRLPHAARKRTPRRPRT